MKEWSQWWKRVKTGLLMGKTMLLIVTSVERKDITWTSEATLRQTIWKESPSLAACVEMYSAQEGNWGDTNVKKNNQKVVTDIYFSMISLIAISIRNIASGIYQSLSKTRLGGGIVAQPLQKKLKNYYVDDTLNWLADERELEEPFNWIIVDQCWWHASDSYMQSLASLTTFNWLAVHPGRLKSIICAEMTNTQAGYLKTKRLWAQLIPVWAAGWRASWPVWDWDD